MNRTKFYQVEIVKGVPELDYLNNTLASFTMVHEPEYYMVDAGDIAAPDLVSYTNYGTERFWWIICLVNNIDNPFTGLSVGQRLIIPSIYDIDAFYTKYKMR